MARRVGHDDGKAGAKTFPDVLSPSVIGRTVAVSRSGRRGSRPHRHVSTRGHHTPVVDAAKGRAAWRSAAAPGGGGQQVGRVTARARGPTRTRPSPHSSPVEWGSEMDKSKKEKRAHVPTVIVGVQVLETRLDVALAQGLGPDQRAAADGVRRLLRMAEDAAYGVVPRTGWFGRWWRGTLVESAFQDLHAARAQMVDVYADEEIAAEIPAALARSQQALHPDDPRQLAGESLSRMTIGQQRAFLRRAIEDSYDAMDHQHERLRNFRNIILMAALCIAVLVGATILIVRANPTYIPLCFAASGDAIEGSLVQLPYRHRRLG